jgi:hypothetical protein
MKVLWNALRKAWAVLCETIKMTREFEAQLEAKRKEDKKSNRIAAGIKSPWGRPAGKPSVSDLKRFAFPGVALASGPFNLEEITKAATTLLSFTGPVRRKSKPIPPRPYPLQWRRPEDRA